MRLAVPVLVLAVLAPACKPAPDQGSIQILTVDDPFPGPPPATELTIDAIELDGGVSTLAQGPATQGSLDLGTYDETDTEAILVKGTDRAGTTVAWGETLPLELGVVAGLTLGVFVQRTGTLSRMPSPLGDSRPSPIATILGGRYIFVSGGADAALGTQTRLYDLISWAPLSSPPALPFAPSSVAVAQLTALAINATGAQWYDLTASTTTDAGAPPGAGAWADVAGGATITSTDQSTSFVVGATRTSGAPTSAVLIVTSSGTLSWASLTTPRLGAAAAWLDGYGLIVEGGNVTSTSTSAGAANGMEYLAAGSTSAVAFPYPADPTTGAGMTALDATHVLVVGGASGGDAGAGGTAARLFAVPCTTGPCTATVWTTVLPSALTFAQAFRIDATSAFVTGEDGTGAMHAYRLSATTVAEVPFRVPRSHARAVRLPIGAPGAGPIAVVGGAPYIESFTP